MTKFRLSGIGVSAAALLLLAGCDESMYEGSGTGTIAPVVTYDATVVGARSAGSRVEFSDLTVDDLTLSLTKADGSFAVEFPYGEFPQGQYFTVGKYTMAASYGNQSAEGFETPAVYGSADFAVNEGKTTRVDLVAKPSKAMVGIQFDESLLDYMSEITASVRTAYNTISYAIDETRCVYTRPGQVAIDVAFTKPNGKKGELEAISFAAEAQNRYNITVKLGGDGAGSVEGISVVYEDATTEETVDLDISDEILIVPAPEITISGAENGEVLYAVEGSALESNPSMKVIAKGKIKSALLSTTGSLLEKGWPQQVDLASASDSQLATLEEMGLKGATTFRNGSKLALIDFANVAKNIEATAENSEPTMFSLTVTDANNKVSEPVGFGVKVDRIELSLSAISGVKYTGASTVDVQMGYNGSEPLENVVKVSYLSESGTFRKTTIAKVAAASRASELYVVSVNIPSDAQLPLVIKASAGGVETDEIEVPAGEAPVLAVNGNDVFATHLLASLSGSVDFSKADVKLQISTDGKQFTDATGSLNGSEYHLTGGVAPGTAYKVRAKVGAMTTNVVAVTTEAALALENGNMNEWTEEKISKGLFQPDKWTKFTPLGPWNTLNELTLSKLSNTAVRSGAESTVADNGGIGGSRCAAVRTVGYGGATTFSSSTNYAGGELYLGTVSGTTPNYGTPFTSRPSAVQFQWKLSAFKSGDRAMATVEVLDSAGNVIAEASATFGESADFALATLPLTYGRNSAKAATLRLKFRSTTKQNSELGSGDVCKISGGDASTKFTGTTFYVDDVELVY
ncbi:MAG: DUF4493 domain-containing protein [Bacteroides sp.]|nr:DUF4493 domain-containing protein [Bacteroides sp.]